MAVDLPSVCRELCVVWRSRHNQNTAHEHQLAAPEQRTSTSAALGAQCTSLPHHAAVRHPSNRVSSWSWRAHAPPLQRFQGVHYPPEP